MTNTTNGVNETKATVLREADNKVNITGVLVEKNLEVRELTRKNDGTKYNAMMGTLSVRSGENETHNVRFFANELTNAGAENRQFKSLKTIMDEYVSVADLADISDPEAKASEINIVGGLELNEYFGADGQLRSNQQVSGRFANRLREQDDPTGKAEYDIEGVVSKVIEEFDKDGDETGRAKVELLVPLYGGKVVPMSFVVGENGKDYVMENFIGGASVRVYGNIVNFRKVTEKRIAMGFGEDKIEEQVSFVNEMLISGGTVYEEDVHDAKIFNLELLKQAGVARQVYLEQLKTRSEQQAAAPSNTQRNTFGSGAPSKPAGKSEAEKSGVDLSKLF